MIQRELGYWFRCSACATVFGRAFHPGPDRFLDCPECGGKVGTNHPPKLRAKHGRSSAPGHE